MINIFFNQSLPRTEKIKKYMKNESVELSSFAKNLSIIKETNMEYFINYCIQNSY